MTNEFYTEVLEVYKTLSSPFHFENFPANKLPIALKAMGIEPPSEDSERRSNEMEPIELKEFLKIISEQYLNNLSWMRNSLVKSFQVFDKDHNGYIDPTELKRVFTKLGETVTDADIEDQLREYDIDGDSQMVQSEWIKMIAATGGNDFIFDDA